MRRRWAALALLMAIGVAVFAVWSLTRGHAVSKSALRSAAGGESEAERSAGPPAGGKAEPETTDEREQGIDKEKKKEGEDRFIAVPRHPDATVRVLVNDDKGRPCAGAHVRAGVVRDDVGMAGPEVETGPDGRAELRVEAAETVGVHVRVGGYSRYTPATIHPQETTELTVVMPTGARVVGAVHHATKGPLYGVGLSAEFQKGSRTDYLHAATDAEGRFVLEPIPRGECKVSLSLGSGTLKDWIKVTVEGEETIDAGTIVVGGGAIEGVVRDTATGRALPGVRIDLTDPVRLYTTTDFEGRFRFDDLTPCTYHLWAEREGYGGRGIDDIEVGAEKPAEVQVALEPAVVLHLRVHDTDGRPVVGQVSLVASGNGQGGGGFIDLDESGEGRYAQLAPGRYKLQVQRGDLRGVDAAVELAPGENTVDLKVQRHVWGNGVRSLSGTVRDAVTGKALAGVRVAVMGLETYSDEAGQYVLHDVWPGKHHIWLVKDGYADLFPPAMVLAAGEQRQADFAMEPAATVELRLKDRRGQPVAGTVDLFYRRIEGDRRGANMSLVTDESGVVVFRRLLQGRHRLDVSVHGIGGKELETTISSGRNEISLVLE